jgi:quercetin 2,3-dioxygenase
MSIAPRRAADRGHFDHGWLDTSHTFSFAGYRDPRFMGFGPLRVINEDRVAPGAGFPTHGHRDMEILSYVIEGALEHRDSLGNGSVIRPGEVQVMSAGTGVTHSEFNASKSETVHFLQIWIVPDRQNLAPRYAQQEIGDRRGRLRLIASRDGRDGSVAVSQDVAIFAAQLAPGEKVVHNLAAGRRAWVQVARGEIDVGGVPARAGDGLAVEGEERLAIVATAAAAEFLVFDLP